MTDPLLYELKVDIVSELNWVACAAVHDVLGCGTAKHEGLMVSMVSLINGQLLILVDKTWKIQSLTCKKTASPLLLCPDMYRFGFLRPGAGCVVHGPEVDMLLKVQSEDRMFFLACAMYLIEDTVIRFRDLAKNPFL